MKAAAIGFGVGIFTCIFIFHKKKYNSSVQLYYNQNYYHIFSRLARISLKSGVIPASVQPRFRFRFRRVRNPSFLSKIQEKVVFLPYERFLVKNKIFHTFEVGFRKNENALKLDIQVNQTAKSIFFQSYPLVKKGKPFDNFDFNLGNSHSFQMFQNVSARVITGAPKHKYFTDVLRNLHRLPLRHNIGFKVFSLITILAPLRALRSANPRVYPKQWTSL